MDRNAGRDLDLTERWNVNDLQQNDEHLRCKLAQSESSVAQYREALAAEKLRADELAGLLNRAWMEIDALTEANRRLTEAATGKAD